MRFASPMGRAGAQRRPAHVTETIAGAHVAAATARRHSEIPAPFRLHRTSASPSVIVCFMAADDEVGREEDAPPPSEDVEIEAADGSSRGVFNVFNEDPRFVYPSWMEIQTRL